MEPDTEDMHRLVHELQVTVARLSTTVEHLADAVRGLTRSRDWLVALVMGAVLLTILAAVLTGGRLDGVK